MKELPVHRFLHDRYGKYDYNSVKINWGLIYPILVDLNLFINLGWLFFLNKQLMQQWDFPFSFIIFTKWVTMALSRNTDNTTSALFPNRIWNPTSFSGAYFYCYLKKIYSREAVKYFIWTSLHCTEIMKITLSELEPDESFNSHTTD